MAKRLCWMNPCGQDDPKYATDARVMAGLPDRLWLQQVGWAKLVGRAEFREARQQHIRAGPCRPDSLGSDILRLF